MSKTLSYKGYTGSIEASIEDDCLHGKIFFIEDIITYEGSTVKSIKNSFGKAVDRYISYCAETGKPANKPYSGTFNVRVGQELHRQAVQEAFGQNTTLNDFVAQCIKKGIEQSGLVKIEHTLQHNITITDVREAGTMVATTMQNPNLPETFSLRDVTEMIIKHKNIHEGLYNISIEFQMAVGAVSPTPDSTYPGALIGVSKIGLSRTVTANADTVDASKVNPPRKKKLKKVL